MLAALDGDRQSVVGARCRPGRPAHAGGRPRGAGGPVRRAAGDWCSPRAAPRPTRWRSTRSAPAAASSSAPTEHDAVRSPPPRARPSCRSTSDGVADLDALARLLADGPAALVCLMLANNETGVIQPVAEAAALCRRHGALLHVDAVQAAGRIAGSAGDWAPTAWRSRRISWADRRAPARCCWRRKWLRITPLIAGGGQERGRRGGTPALPAIAGFAAAARTHAGFDRRVDLAHVCADASRGRRACRLRSPMRVRRRRTAAAQHHLPRPARACGPTRR